MSADVTPELTEADFARQFERIADALVRLAYVICGDPEMARDAAQEGWSHAWSQRERLRDASRFEPWLVSIVANEARRLRRRRSLRRRLEAISGPPAMSTEISPEAHIDMVDLLANISVADRTLLGLRYVLGYSSSEIALLMGASAATVRMRLSRLNARLREELQ